MLKGEVEFLFIFSYYQNLFKFFKKIFLCLFFPQKAFLPKIFFPSQSESQINDRRRYFQSNVKESDDRFEGKTHSSSYPILPSLFLSLPLSLSSSPSSSLTLYLFHAFTHTLSLFFEHLGITKKHSNTLSLSLSSCAPFRI